jgi:hypothetical protein
MNPQPDVPPASATLAVNGKGLVKLVRRAAAYACLLMVISAGTLPSWSACYPKYHQDRDSRPFSRSGAARHDCARKRQTRRANDAEICLCVDFRKRWWVSALVH